jgi:hypothetical protein
MDIIDHFSSTYCLLVVGLLECVVVGWVYDLVPLDEEAQQLVVAHNEKMQVQMSGGSSSSTTGKGSSSKGSSALGGMGMGIGVSGAPCLVGKQCAFVIDGDDDGDDLESGSATATATTTTTVTTPTTAPRTPAAIYTPAATPAAALITPSVPPLLDPTLPLYDRIVTHALLSSRLQREIAVMTGQDPTALPLLWSLMVKTATPAIILGLLCYNVHTDVRKHGADVYTGVFGWGLCCALPLALLAGSALVPYTHTDTCPHRSSANAANAGAKQRQQFKCKCDGAGAASSYATPVHP